MKLRFIGIDGSMGLKHGETYKVCLSSNADYIVVFFYFENGDYDCCPYSSPLSFAKNWEAV